MEFVFFIIVLLVSVLAEGIIGVRFNMAGIGSIVGIALVGAIPVSYTHLTLPTN